MTQYKKMISILSSLIFVSLFTFQITGCDIPGPICGCVDPTPYAEFMLVQMCPAGSESNNQDTDEQVPPDIVSTCVYERTFELPDKLKKYNSFSFVLENKTLDTDKTLDLSDVVLDSENKKFTIKESVQLDDFEYIVVYALRTQAQDSNQDQDQADQE